MYVKFYLLLIVLCIANHKSFSQLKIDAAPPAVARHAAPISPKQTTPRSVASTGTVPSGKECIHLMPNLDCKLNIDGEDKGKIAAGIGIKIYLAKGYYLIRAFSIDGLDTFKAVYKVDEEGKERMYDVDLMAVTNARLNKEAGIKAELQAKLKREADARAEQARLAEIARQQAALKEEQKRNCPICHGTGFYTQSTTCQSCGGQGSRVSTCSSCRGTGSVTCSKCGGTGECTAFNIASAILTGINNGLSGTYSEPATMSCPRCGGSGNLQCSSCGGSGSSEQSCTECNGTGQITTQLRCTLHD